MADPKPKRPESELVSVLEVSDLIESSPFTAIARYPEGGEVRRVLRMFIEGTHSNAVTGSEPEFFQNTARRQAEYAANGRDLVVEFAARIEELEAATGPRTSSMAVGHVWGGLAVETMEGYTRSEQVNRLTLINQVALAFLRDAIEGSVG